MSENTQTVVERAREEAERRWPVKEVRVASLTPSQYVEMGQRLGFPEGATFAATITPEQVEAAARGMYLADRKDTLPEGFPERQWDNGPGLGTIRDDYVRRATAAFIAAGFQIGADS